MLLAATVTLPRPIYPGSTSMTTRRCTQRQYLLRPDAETNNAFLYCLIVAAQKYEVEVLDFVQMSNHLHDAIYDRHGNAVDELIVKLVATNPVKAGLVDRVADWPGASGHRALVEGRLVRATRPRHFFSEHGTMPGEVAMRLHIPPELGDHDAVVAAVKARVRQLERDEARKRAASGQRVLGRFAVLRQSWRESPTSHEPRSGLRPTFLARSLWTLIERAQRKRQWQLDYRTCRDALLAGERVGFPHGTYWLHRFLAVEVAPAVLRKIH